SRSGPRAAAAARSKTVVSAFRRTTVASARVPLRHLRADVLDEERIDRCAAADEEAVLLLPPEAEVGARLGNMNLADQIPVRGVAAHACFVCVADDTLGPNVTIYMRPFTVG